MYIYTYHIPLKITAQQLRGNWSELVEVITRPAGSEDGFVFLVNFLGLKNITGGLSGDGSKPWYLLFTPSHSWDLWM